MRYSGGLSNDILGPGNGAMANAFEIAGGLGANSIVGPLKNIGVGYKTVPAPELNPFPGIGNDPRKIVDYLTGGPLSSAGSDPGNGMYNNGYLAGGPELFPIPRDINAGEVRGRIEGVQGGARNDISRPFGGLQGNPRQPRLQAQMNLPGKQEIPQVAGQFMTPGFKQEIPQISTGPYTGTPWEGFGPIGTYKGGSFAVPLPYYG